MVWYKCIKKGRAFALPFSLLRGVDLVPRHGVNPFQERNQVVHPLDSLLHRVKRAGGQIGQIVGGGEGGGVGDGVLHDDGLQSFVQGIATLWLYNSTRQGICQHFFEKKLKKLFVMKTEH